MSQPNREDRALDQLVREVRDEGATELDWDRVEKQLMQRIDSDESIAGAPGRWRWVAALAAAALIALGVGAVLRHPAAPVARAPQPQVQQGPHVVSGANVDGTRLAVGDVVQARDSASRVHHPGHVDWTLARGGRAVLAENGAVITVKLLSGSLEASVVPSTKPETFAVEVDDTRVAVHGTKFRVERGSDGVQVEVSEGVVGVGPIADRGRPQWLLRHGDSGHFALDGRHGEVKRAEVAAVEPSPPEAPTPVPALPAAVSGKELAHAGDELSRTTTMCFAANTAAKAAVRVQVETTMSVSVAPNGSIRSVTFDPPLLPSVQDCVRSHAKKIRLSPSQKGGNTARSLLLGS